MKTRLTDKTLAKLPVPSEGRVDVFDTLLPGFGVRVTAKGRRTFFCFYRVDRKQVRQSLGAYFPKLEGETESKGVSLAEAREAARRAMAKATQNEDPRDQPAEVLPDAARETFSDVIDDYLKYHAKVKLKARTAAAYERELARVRKKIGQKPITAINRRQVLNVTEGYLKDGKAAQAAQTHRILSSVFNWCVQRGVLTASPMAGLKVPAKVRPRDRVLTDDELRTVWAATTSLPYPFGPFVRLLLLTGQRETELAHMRWDAVDGAAWTIQDTKRGTPHRVLLPDLAVAELDALPRFTAPYVFSGTAGERPVSGFSRAKRTLDAELARLHAAAPWAWPEVAPWRFHDLRRTAASGMAGLGVSPHVIEHVLNHRSGVVSGIARVYNRYQYETEGAAALGTWAAHVHSLVYPGPHPRPESPKP